MPKIQLTQIRPSSPLKVMSPVASVTSVFANIDSKSGMAATWLRSSSISSSKNEGRLHSIGRRLCNLLDLLLH